MPYTPAATTGLYDQVAVSKGQELPGLTYVPNGAGKSVVVSPPVPKS